MCQQQDPQFNQHLQQHLVETDWASVKELRALCLEPDFVEAHLVNGCAEDPVTDARPTNVEQLKLNL